jgi:hypothetical protein
MKPSITKQRGGRLQNQSRGVFRGVASLSSEKRVGKLVMG